MKKVLWRVHRGWVARSVLPVFALIAGGCSSVATDLPLPRTEASHLEAEIEGTWIGEDSVYDVEFVEQGFALVASRDRNDADSGVEDGELTLSTKNDRSFISVRCREDGEWSESFLLYEVGFGAGDTDYLLVWVPEEDRFEEAIENGLLKGTTDDGVTITSRPGDLLDLLADESVSYFDYRNPLIFRRLPEGRTSYEEAEATETSAGLRR